MKWLIILCIVQVLGDSYDRFSGKKVDEAVNNEMRLKNATELCSIDIKPCTKQEDRRIDGTCNNYKEPSKGAARGPYLRLLLPDYGDKGGIRIAKNGDPLPSARKVRTTLLSTGRVEDKKTFTAAVPAMLEFIHRDVSLLNGSDDYLKNRPHCCKEEGKSDPRCIPITVPKDDPYLKVTDITCLNFSRAETFQDTGCTPEIIPPEQINYQTPLLDLSTIYGVDDKALAKVRKNELGLLILEKRFNIEVPLAINNNLIAKYNITTKEENVTKTDNSNSTVENMITTKIDNLAKKNSTTVENICVQNMKNESLCYQFGFPEAGNHNLRTTTLGIFFMREHNRIARALHKINPCWKDDRLFKVARQINIATAANIYMYELLPALLGYRNMLNYGLISSNVEQISTYEEKLPPLVFAEFEIATRFFHTMMDGRIKKYTEKHQYSGELSVSETLYRQAVLEQDGNLEEINRGTFYQGAAKIDDILDPEISEHYFGNLQGAHDLGAIDIQRGRDMGIRGYNEYRQLCGLKTVKKFEELADLMDVEKIEGLKSIYKHVDDIDLLAGIFSEKSMQGTHVGPTLFCIMAKQLEIFRYSDRFWFERGDQFHSFSIDQLYEIRKSSIASLACDNAEGIRFIQPQAFYSVKPGNTPVPCTHIARPDLGKWMDNTCFPHKYSHEATHVPMSFMEQGFGPNANFSRFFEELLYYKPSHHMLPKF